MTTHRRSLIVTGAGGFVAGSILAQAGDTWDVHAVSRGEPALQRPWIHWHRFDPAETAKLDALASSAQPHAIIHTAALADIDFCQANRDKATEVNTTLTRSIADICRTRGLRLVFCSTDTVFDGEHAPYREQDTPVPVNFYAETKIAAEKIVSELGGLGVIARLSLVIGLPIAGVGNSFTAKVVASLKEGRKVTVPVEEIRTPIDVITLGQALLELAGNEFSGAIHLSGNDRLNRLELCHLIASQWNLSPEPIQASAPTAIAGRAPRPRDVSLDNSLAASVLNTPLRGATEGLALWFSDPVRARIA